jgi:hypothetical protein
MLGEVNDARDLTSAAMKLGADAKSLIITVRGPHLAPQVPTGNQGSFVQIAWYYRDHPYLVTVTTSLSETKAAVERLTFDRESPKQPEKKKVDAAYGPGTLTVTVPLSDIENPRAGERLQYPVATSGVLTAVPGVLAIPDVQDAAGPDRDQVLSEHCN